MMGIERAMDAIAWRLGKDPLDVRLANLYGVSGDQTPYGQVVTDSVAFELMTELEHSCNYRARRAAITAWNARNPYLKRGMALTPVKFGISFTANHLNQAGALDVYTDGSIHLNHGGTEMGQGLNIKVAQVVAHEFQVPLAAVKITSTRTDKVPNTSATAASSGSDLNGMAAQAACQAIKARLVAFAAKEFGCKPARWPSDPTGHRRQDRLSSQSLRRLLRRTRSAPATPHAGDDRARHTAGRPLLCLWRGLFDANSRRNRVPALTLRPLLTRGGLARSRRYPGGLTTEELVFDERRAQTHAPSTYKIPPATGPTLQLV